MLLNPHRFDFGFNKQEHRESNIKIIKSEIEAPMSKIVEMSMPNAGLGGDHMMTPFNDSITTKYFDQTLKDLAQFQKTPIASQAYTNKFSDKMKGILDDKSISVSVTALFFNFYLQFVSGNRKIEARFEANDHTFICQTEGENTKQMQTTH